MPEQLLDGPDVVPIFEEVRRERVAERVGRDMLRDHNKLRSPAHGLLDDGPVQVVTCSIPVSRFR